MSDYIDRQTAIDAKQEFRNPNVVRSTEARTAYDRAYANGWNDCNSAWIDVINALPSTQSNAITASLEELINDYGEDGYFIVDGVNYQANELLNELKINSSVGEKFRKKIAKTIIQYFMKFGD